jgi:hypothetical protein
MSEYLERFPVVPESTRNAILYCLHSNLPCNSKDLMPDYKCEFTGGPCVLYRECSCERREEFPAVHDG